MGIAVKFQFLIGIINPIISAEKIGETVFQFLIGIINQYKEAYMKLRELSFNSS
mgnify:CR=1 FL=1